MNKLDRHFSNLRDVPLPAGLAVIESCVFEGIAARREATVARRGLILAAAVSLVVGLSASLLPTTEARAEPLLGVPAEAPSRLLGQ
jgi:hypothetical protein